MQRLGMILAVALLAAPACSKKDDKGGEAKPAAAEGAKADEAGKAKTPEKPAEAEKAPAEAEKAPPAAEGLALVDFPNTALEAEVGQYVFAPNDSTLVSAHESENERDRGVFRWSIVKLKSVGEIESEVRGMGDPYKVPNAYLLPLPKGPQVAVGDIVATSKYGNSFERAYVMEVGDKVKANFIQQMPHGDKSADLKPDQFRKLEEGVAPGSPVAVRVAGKVSKTKMGGLDLTATSPDSLELYTVLRVEGDKVLLTGHMGKIAMAPKAAMVPVPLAPGFKKGDAVCAVWDTLHFADGTIKKVDDKLGHYQVDFGAPKGVKSVPFAEALPGTKADYLK